MAHVLGISRLALYLQHDRPLAAAELASLRALVARRGEHEPVPYLTGSCEFHGLTFAVEPSVLIPRPETEGLVELALRQAPPHSRCIELGVGSGAIAVSLAKHRPDLTVVAVDCSEAALQVAARNAAQHAVADRIELRHGDYWSPIGADERFDLLVSNPPYVDPAQPELLADDVRRYEPAAALFTVAGDPASSYRRILGGVTAHLRPGAPLLLETGAGADAAALALLREQSFLTEVELSADLAGLPRYLTARLTSTATCEAT